MESVIRDVIFTLHFTDNNLYAECQHVFHSKRSCMSQLMQVLEDLTTLLDDRNPVDVIYLDFLKAFESVPHKSLLQKMKAYIPVYIYSTTGSIFSWTRNVLVQKVRVGGASSTDARVLSSIPQGSILRPVLFTVFINDLPDGAQSSCKILVDDFKIHDTASNSRRIQEDIDCKGGRKNEIYILTIYNIEKCKVMHMGCRNPCNTYTLGNVSSGIKTSEEEKDLGVTFDLNFFL